MIGLIVEVYQSLDLFVLRATEGHVVRVVLRQPSDEAHHLLEQDVGAGVANILSIHDRIKRLDVFKVRVRQSL